MLGLGHIQVFPRLTFSHLLFTHGNYGGYLYDSRYFQGMIPLQPWIKSYIQRFVPAPRSTELRVSPQKHRYSGKVRGLGYGIILLLNS